MAAALAPSPVLGSNASSATILTFVNAVFIQKEVTNTLLIASPSPVRRPFLLVDQDVVGIEVPGWNPQRVPC